MSIERNGIPKKYKILHNGQKLKKAFYNGLIKLWSAGNIVTYYEDVNEVYKEEVDEGKTCLTPKTFIPQKNGWIFAGWREDANAIGPVLSEKLMGDDPINLYGVFANPVALMYDGNGADNTDMTINYSWKDIVSAYKNNLVISDHSKLGVCAKFKYGMGKGDLNARLSLNTPVSLGGDIAPNKNYVGVEIEFVIDNNYTNANGFDLYICKSTVDDSNSAIKFKINHSMLSRYNYIDDGSYELTKVGSLKWADINRIKIVVDRANGYCTYFLNGECIEDNLPPLDPLETLTDIGVVCIHTPNSSRNIVNDLYVSKLVVYEISQDGRRSFIVNEDYSDYTVGALVVNSRSGAKGAIGYDKADYYNNGNTTKNSFTLIGSPFTKSGYYFTGWDVGLPGNKISLTADGTAMAQWADNVKDISYSGSVYEFSVLAEGRYLLEAWGAQGGGYSSAQGGKGGYSYGQVLLQRGQVLYFCVGGQGIVDNGTAGEVSGATDTLIGGYNGGGNGSNNNHGASGGGATHIALSDGTLADLADDKASILLVAGGGGGATLLDDRLLGGGAGGGAKAGDGFDNEATGGSTKTEEGNITPIYGTNFRRNLTASHNIQLVEPGFGTGGGHLSGTAQHNWYTCAGGGGGYAGGGCAATEGIGYTSSGAGGSGYIAGVTDGYTENGVNSGNGKARITYLGAV